MLNYDHRLEHCFTVFDPSKKELAGSILSATWGDGNFRSAQEAAKLRHQNVEQGSQNINV